MEKVSIIVPCLNEADYIGFLLFSLSRQTYRGFEVIVSDGESEDQTRAVVKSFKEHLPALSFIKNGKRSPAVQRNTGTKIARYERILFLDADVILPPDFLQKTLAEIEEHKYDLAHPTYLPLSEKLANRYYYLLNNFGVQLMQNFYPVAGAGALYTTKTWHNKLRGFDERFKVVAEDVDYVSRAVKKGARFSIIKNCSPYVSVRRLDREGIGGSIKNMLFQGILFGLLGKRKAQKYLSREYGNFGGLQMIIEKEGTSNKILKKLTPKQLKGLGRELKKILRGI